MKRLSFYFLTIIAFSFILVQSCSTEEENSSVPTVQTPELEQQVKQYTLTVTSAEGGTVSSEGGTYDEGTEVTITATPSEGYRFTGWEGNDSTSESLTITLNSNQTYQALFELIPIYTLTIASSEGGTVSIEGGEYQEGTEVEITATPEDGYRFVSWGGAAGTIFWIDPVEEISVISMIQLMNSPWPLRKELKVATYQSLVEINE